MFKKNSSLILLILFSILSVGLFLYRLTSSPPCLNADEATNAYDAYSILKTGKDQYGNFLPLRFKSFGDYKLPLLTYLAVYWIKIFGLTEFGIRMVNLPFVFFFPIIIYFFVLELFNKKNIALIASFIGAFSPGLQLLGRQAHEGYMTAFFLTLTFYFFVVFIKKRGSLNFLFFILSFFFSLFGYHSTRLWAGLIFLIFIYLFYKKKINFSYLLVLLSILGFFIFTDIKNTPSRIKNLLFFNNIGFNLKINELRAEGGNRLFYNKLTVGIKEIVFQYLSYFSPQFLVINGDENIRFGFPGLSPITPFEYLFIFIGLYYLFKNKEKWRYFILTLFLFSPLSGALSWAGLSITRTIFIFVPITITVSYGVFYFFKEKKYFYFAFFGILVYLFFLFYSWDFYLNHYPKRAAVLRSWQCGYKELTSYIKENYHNFDKFYITKKNGQPYIFLLFYLKYDPLRYQKIAKLSPPDEYGFGQVENFDKFVFNIPNKLEKNTAVIGFPDDFGKEEKNLKEIKVLTETIFKIKEIK